jgi:hypothetical protein
MRLRPIGLGLLAVMLVGGCGGMGNSGNDASASAPDGGRGAATVVVEGDFEGRRRYDTAGAYELERVGGDLSLVLGDDFETEQGPDLWVVLSPVDTSDVTAQNVETEGAVVVDSLRSVSGRQTYALRGGLQVDSLGSVAIHCREFDALFGVAPLK